MSSRKGSVNKSGPPAHQNRTAYKHNKGSVKTEKILKSPIAGLCQHCRDIVEWRKAFRKYKPLTTPKKCVACESKTITMAYHVLCDKCAGDRKVCAKCMQTKDILPTSRRSQESKDAEQRAEQQILEQMSERQRRTYLRAKAEGRLRPGDPIPRRPRQATDGEDGDEDDFDDDFDDEDDDDDSVKKTSLQQSSGDSVDAPQASIKLEKQEDLDEEDDDEEDDEEEEEEEDDE